MKDFRTLLRGCFVALTTCSLLLMGCGGTDDDGPEPVEPTALADLDEAGIQALCDASTVRLDQITTPSDSCNVGAISLALIALAAEPAEGEEALTTEEAIAQCQENVSLCEAEAPASFGESGIPCNLQGEKSLDGCTATDVEYSACTVTGGDALEAAWNDVKDVTCDDMNDMESLTATFGPYMEQDNTPECQVLADKCPGLFEGTVSGGDDPPPLDDPPDQA